MDTAIIIFAKAPVAGYAKTRLARVLGDERAAHLAARMLTHTVDKAIDAALGPIELCCTPDATHAAFQRAAQHAHITLTEQGDGDLGMRMDRALTRALQHAPRALLIGTDAPLLDAQQLRAATHALNSNAAVFVPATDGGYVLVGLAQPLPDIFSGIAWSTAQVMAQTRERIALLGVTAAELPALPDVDEAADLVHVPEEWLR